MYHFFRRIRQSLLANNRFRKYLTYAVGEIALVMIGILLALQVNNWNQNIKAANTEQALLLDLRNEFITNDSLLQAQLKRADEIMSEMKRSLYFMGPESLAISLDDYEKVVEITKHTIIYLPNTSVVDDIINSGQLQYLTDKHLRRSLSDWRGYLNRVHLQEQIVEGYRDQMKNITRQNVTMSIFFQHQKVAGLDSVDLGPRDFEFNPNELLADREYENLILYKITSTTGLIRIYNILSGYINSILGEIEKQIR